MIFPPCTVPQLCLLIHLGKRQNRSKGYWSPRGMLSLILRIIAPKLLINFAQTFALTSRGQ